MQKRIVSCFTKGVMDKVRDSYPINLPEEIVWVSKNKAHVLSKTLYVFENIGGRIYFSYGEKEKSAVIAFAKNRNEMEIAIRGFICGL